MALHPRLVERIWLTRSRGVRLYRMAIDADISPPMLSAWLTGAAQPPPNDPRIVKLGAALGLSASELIAPPASDEPGA